MNKQEEKSCITVGSMYKCYRMEGGYSVLVEVVMWRLGDAEDHIYMLLQKAEVPEEQKHMLVFQRLLHLKGSQQENHHLHL